MIRVLIADDHVLIRSGLRYFLNEVPDIHVVAMAEDGNQVLDCLRIQPVDLLLLDLGMPGLNGEALISRICAVYPRVPMLVLSAHDEPIVAQRAIRAGAAGFISKSIALPDLVMAVRDVAAGGRYIETAIALRIAQEHASIKPRPPLERLTGREFQIMRLLVEGMSVKNISDQLMISNKTVSTHKARLMGKMGFLCTGDIVKYSLALRAI